MYSQSFFWFNHQTSGNTLLSIRIFCCGRRPSSTHRERTNTRNLILPKRHVSRPPILGYWHQATKSGNRRKDPIGTVMRDSLIERGRGSGRKRETGCTCNTRNSSQRPNNTFRSEQHYLLSLKLPSFMRYLFVSFSKVANIFKNKIKK